MAIRSRRGTRRLALTMMAALLAACGGGGGDDGGGGGTAAQLPAGAAATVQDTSKVALGATLEEAVGAEPEPVLGAPEDVVYPYDPAEPDAANPVETTVRVRNLCTTRSYDITSNPREVILYNVNANLAFPGALLRGDEFRAGRLARLGVAPEHRAPLSFVISNVYSQTGTTSGTVPNPDLKPMDDAVKARIVAAYNDNIPIGDSVAFSYEETSDVGRFMLKAKISARYGIVSGALGTTVDKRQSERSIVVHLTQKLFDVTIQQPPTRNDWFNSQFFAGGLKPLLDSGEFSAANQPVYVARVTYGRVLTFTMTSTASRSDIEAMLRLKVKTLAAGGSLQLDSKSTNINTSKKINVASIGGSGADAIAAATTGDWGSFFKKQLALTQAVPIMVDYANLYDNSPAGVTEVTRATEEVCTPQLVVPGTFDFGLQDLHERPEGLGAVNQTAAADFNGDGATDVVWNELSGNSNRFYIGFGGKSGRLRIEPHACGGSAPCDLSDARAWGQHRLLTGDFNGDGRADLAWLRAGPTRDAIELHALLAGPDGRFDPAAPVRAVLPVDAAAVEGMRSEVIVKDLTNDDVDGTGRGRDDILLWFVTRNAASQNLVYTQVVRSVPTAGGGIEFQFGARTGLGGFTDRYNTNPATARFSLQAIDIDSDGWRDLVLNLQGQDFDASGPFTDQRNVLVPALNQQASDAVSFALGTTFVYGSSNGWSHYRPVFGDFDGDADVDVAWVNNGDSYTGSTSGNVGAVHQTRFDSNTQAFAGTRLQWWTQARNTTFELLRDFNPDVFTLETNGDSAQDVVVTRYLTPAGSTAPTFNAIAVMKGVGNGDPMFNTAPEPQQHPVVQDWRNFTHLLTGDFNGDRLQDVLWSNGALDNASYIAFAKREADQGAR